MNILSQSLVLVIFISIKLTAFGVTKTAFASGDWKDDANWTSASYPNFDQTNGSDDLVIDITGGTPGKITLNDNFTLKNGTVLTVRGCDTLHITGNVVFSNGSFLEVEGCAVLIVDGNVQNKNNSNNIVIDGFFDIGGDFDGGTGSVISGSGTIDVAGTVTLSGSGTITTIVLPVDLLYFNAIFNTDKVDIRWSTASELNNNFFVIERSQDGYNWQEINRVTGSGNSSVIREYFEVDLEPLSGKSFYRLTQIDHNGQSQTFNIVPVENIEEGKVTFNIFPNPTSQYNISLFFQGFDSEEVLVVLRDMRGKEYYSKVTLIENPNEIQLLSVENNLPAGVYLITASSINELYSQKVTIK
jgi:hypothetical protein